MSIFIFILLSVAATFLIFLLIDKVRRNPFCATFAKRSLHFSFRWGRARKCFAFVASVLSFAVHPLESVWWLHLLTRPCFYVTGFIHPYAHSNIYIWKRAKTLIMSAPNRFKLTKRHLFLGRELAKEYSRFGARIVIAARSKDVLEKESDVSYLASAHLFNPRFTPTFHAHYWKPGCRR